MVMEVEQFYFKFSNYVLGVPYNAESNAVYGETGIFPCWLRSYSQFIDYYGRIIEDQAQSFLMNALNVSQQTNGWWNNLKIYYLVLIWFLTVHC